MFDWRHGPLALGAACCPVSCPAWRQFCMGGFLEQIHHVLLCNGVHQNHSMHANCTQTSTNACIPCIHAHGIYAWMHAWMHMCFPAPACPCMHCACAVMLRQLSLSACSIWHVTTVAAGCHNSKRYRCDMSRIGHCEASTMSTAVAAVDMGDVYAMNEQHPNMPMRRKRKEKDIHDYE